MEPSMTLDPQSLFALLLLVFVLMLSAVTIGIRLGQSGTIQVGTYQDAKEIRMQRQLRKVGRMVGLAEHDMDDVINDAMQRMRDAANRR
jgi:protein-disulfide isomerase-like protein with CxxC motif